MKRGTSLLAMVLLLIVVLCGESFPMAHPQGYRDPGMGEDHNWGGEQEGSDPPALRTGQSNSGTVVTGFVHLDIFINSFFMEWLYGDLPSGQKVDPTMYYIIPYEQQDVENPGATANNKGN